MCYIIIINRHFSINNLQKKLNLRWYLIFLIVEFNMEYIDHPEYPKYKDMIKAILKVDYPISKEIKGNIFSKCPPLLEDQFYKSTHHSFKGIIGQKYRKLTALGFLKQNNMSSSKLEVIYKCDCQRYMVAKPTLFKNITDKTVLCCSYCSAKIESFNIEFNKRHGYYLDSAIVRSIGGIHDGSELINFISGPSPKNKRYIANEGLLLGDQSIKTLTALMRDNNPILNSEFYRHSCEDGRVNYIVRNHTLANTFITPPTTLDLYLLTYVPHQLKEAIGKRIFRLTVFGIYQNFKPLKMSNITYVCKCDCGYYTNIAHSNLKTTDLPCCPRCFQIVKAFISIMRKTDQTIEPKEAFQCLGFDTSFVPAQIEDLKTIKTNSYNFKKKVYEPETTSLNYQKYIGHRLGFTTVISKSKKINDGTRRTPFICECICGSDCVVSFELIHRYKHNLYIGCSACATHLQSVTGIAITLGSHKNSVAAKWQEFIRYKGLSTTKVDLYSMYKKWLELKSHNPQLILETAITQIIKQLAKE